MWNSVSFSELSGQKAFSAPCVWDQWAFTSGSGSLISVAVAYFCQSAEAAGESTTDAWGTDWTALAGCCPSSEGRGRHLPRAAAHCGNSVFSGSLKGDKRSHLGRVWLWPHFTDDQVPQCQPTKGFSSTALSNTRVLEANTCGISILSCKLRTDPQLRPLSAACEGRGWWVHLQEWHVAFSPLN